MHYGVVGARAHAVAIARAERDHIEVAGFIGRAIAVVIYAITELRGRFGGVTGA
jgi:hypothetical protein